MRSRRHKCAVVELYDDPPSVADSEPPTEAPKGRKRRLSCGAQSTASLSEPSSHRGESSKRKLQNAIRKIYLVLRRRRLLTNWHKVVRLYRSNEQKVEEQLDASQSTRPESEENAVGYCSAIAAPAPVEIPQLYSQMGRFDTKINGKDAHIGAMMIPPVR